MTYRRQSKGCMYAMQVFCQLHRVFHPLQQLWHWPKNSPKAYSVRMKKNKFCISGLNSIALLIARLSYKISGVFPGNNTLPEAYNDASASYSKLMRERQLLVQECLVQKIPCLPQKACILDVGCGGGGIAELVKSKQKNQYKEIRYIGIDLSRGMLRIAKKNNNLEANFVVADGAWLPFKDNSFDAVVSNLTLHHSNKQWQFLSELKRTAKEEAPVRISVGGNFYLYEVANKVIETAILPKWFRFFIFQQVQYWPFPEKHLENFLRKLKAEYVLEAKKWQYSFESAEKLLAVFQSLTGEFYLRSVPSNRRNEFNDDVKKKIIRSNPDNFLTDHILFCLFHKEARGNDGLAD